MGITNNGSLGQDKGGGNAYGFWPAPTMDANGELSNKMNYIFGWGLWIGAQIKSTKPGKTRDTMCTFGYNPNNGACEFTAGGVIGGVPQAEASSTVKIYSSDGDWELQNSAGNDSVISMMDTRSIYNDYDILQHATGGKPLKVEVIQTTYQWNYPTNQDIIFFLFEVKNTGTDTLFDVYLAPTADCDIGNESGTAANDVCFFDSTTNMAYQYQTSKKETGWSREPGCVGFMFLESPKATKDFTFPDGYKITKDSTIGLVAFKVFNINIDPPGNLEQYKELAGYNYQTGQFARLDPKPASGDQRFMESTGPIDLLPDSTAKTIVAVIGANFNYTKGVHDTIAIADLRTKAKTAQLIYDANWLLPGPPPAPKLSVTAGHKRVIVGWDNTSEIESDPMKNKNLDYWNKVASDSSTISKFDPNFNAYILQGYKLYKSTDGSVYELMAQWDKDDRFIVDSTGVTVVGPEILKAAIRPTGDTLYHTVVLNSNWIATGKDSTFIWKDNSFITDTRGTNSGLQYSFVDENLINGMTYYYSVRAYGVNWQSTLNGAKDSIIDKSPTYYETSIGENATAVVPRSEPSEYVAPKTWVSDYAGRSYNWGQKISITVDLPRAVKKKTYRQEWGPVTRSGDLDTSSIGTAIQYAPVLSYRVIDMDADTVAVPWTKSTMAYDSVRGWDIFLKTVKYPPGNFITLIN
ncbi:MAG: hypothetical protein Q7U71_10565, partial [bacterium]|nr:hypothetical protein [bacterium]